MTQLFEDLGTNTDGTNLTVHGPYAVVQGAADIHNDGTRSGIAPNSLNAEVCLRRTDLGVVAEDHWVEFVLPDNLGTLDSTVYAGGAIHVAEGGAVTYGGIYVENDGRGFIFKTIAGVQTTLKSPPAATFAAGNKVRFGTVSGITYLEINDIDQPTYGGDTLGVTGGTIGFCGYNAGVNFVDVLRGGDDLVAGGTITSSGSIQADTAFISGTTVNDPVSAIVFSTITTAGSVTGSIQADIATVSGSVSVSNEIAANVDSLTLITYQATILASNTIVANVDALSLITYPAEISVANDITTNVDALSLITYPAEISVANEIQANVGVLALVTYPAVVSVDNDIAAITSLLELVTHTAVITIDNEISANVDVLSLVAYASNIIGGVPVVPLNQGLEYTIPEDFHHYSFEEED